MHRAFLHVLRTLGALSLTLIAPATALRSALPGAPESTADALQQRGWIAAASDNICGLRDLKQLSNPARVDFEALLAATPELVKIAKDNIDPASAEGIQLRQAGIDRVTRASEALRAEVGYCSVWKAIRHSDGRSVPDVTESVKAKLPAA
jgi:hypothetical protein